MKRGLISVGIFFFFIGGVLLTVSPAVAQSSSSSVSSINTNPLPCSTDPRLGNCPKDLQPIYDKEGAGVCKTSYAEFMQNPLANHYWALDEETTTQGKANERARQFIYWAIQKNAIDNHPTLRIIWDATKNVTLFLFILAAALFGLGLIVGQRSNFELKVQVWPIISKIILGMLYIMFSYALVMFIVQISEILTKFFIETLGGDQLFNIYFNGSVSQEQSYVDWVGCKDLNYRVQEAVKTEMLMLKLTNITYYVMGTMIILRKILLWFLLFVAPFLALLMPFVFIRNIGWIWIGVFFQWVFYGPLFALFLGALATIWKRGIPFPFDFSRARDVSGYIYPTGINITYGGPAQIGLQKLGALNNGNYIDTFAEYIITLIMLWAVTFFPWWLLRIFRDYCCDGIYAMKNILLSMYDQSRSAPGPKPPPGPVPVPAVTGTALKIPREINVPVKVRLETMEDIKKTQTEEISKSLNLSMNKITDIARFETNKETHETVKKNLEFLASPTKAESPVERQKFMNIRTELFNRTIKEDRVARQILSSISTSRVEQLTRRQEILGTVPQFAPITQAVAFHTNVSQDKVSSFNNTFVSTVSSNNNLIASVSKSANVTAPQVQTVLSSFKQNVAQTNKTINTVSPYSPPLGSPTVKQTAPSPAQVISNISTQTGIERDKVVTVINEVSKVAVTNTETIKQIATKENMKEEDVQKIITAHKSFKQQAAPSPAQIVSNISKQTGIEKEKVVSVIREVSKAAVADKATVREIATKENMKEEEVKKIIDAQTPLITEPEKHIEQAVSIPPSVSIEDYEEVKKMWIQQYEKGEVPVSENITSREQWVDQDIIFITNTLNKLMSPDEKLKQEGVDDLSYILPIFLINNLKGEELAVYLKAKLEAAKHVKEMKDMEKEITAKLKEKAKDEEEFVDVKNQKKKEEEKHMQMQEEMNLADEKQPEPKENGPKKEAPQKNEPAS